MRRAICRSRDHLFLPVLDVHIPLLRCIHCDVFAYQDTVKELSKKRSYGAGAGSRRSRPAPSLLARLWTTLRRAWS